jgi:hypothetical protein
MNTAIQFLRDADCGKLFGEMSSVGDLSRSWAKDRESFYRRFGIIGTPHFSTSLDDITLVEGTLVLGVDPGLVPLSSFRRCEQVGQ